MGEEGGSELRLQRKEAALDACVDLHRERVRPLFVLVRSALICKNCHLKATFVFAPRPLAVELVACFKTCSFSSAFTGCCTAEHKKFWECYTSHRVCSSPLTCRACVVRPPPLLPVSSHPPPPPCRLGTLIPGHQRDADQVVDGLHLPF